MRTVIVRIPGGTKETELAPGEAATFGRGIPPSHNSHVDITLSGPEVSRLAGVITARDDFWLISNYSANSTYAIRNPDGGGEFIKVAPRRLDMPVPFEFADVVLPAGEDTPAFSVLAPKHTYGDSVPGMAATAPGEPTVAAFPLDETAKYFLILVALCEPRLRDAASVVIPTVPEIIERLCEAGYPRMSRSAVNFQIEYLARRKLRVKNDESGKADWQRAALVSLAIRFDLVGQRHLTLLGLC
ncbi:MAG: FHA domain-containing protein [Streptosporangiales bacterium]|nr:FHA domain-containing protein [Streptosporangiales bacterium]